MPSDIRREQFEAIRAQLECFRRSTKPRQYNLYAIFCGILYSLKTACPWRALPHDYPDHRSAYTYFRQWSAKPFADQPSLMESLLNELAEAECEADGREKQAMLLIIDAQSVKNADTSGTKGYDAGKKVSGIKRHIAVDTRELPHAIALTAADVRDCC